MPPPTLATLNRQFGAAGRIAFRDGPAGQPLAVLAEGRSSCEVALYGGQVTAYRPVGHAPILWMTRDLAALQPGQALRGGIPICWPWFGASPDGAAHPAHGFARNRPWQVAASEYDAQQTTLRLRLEDDAATRLLWPHAFRLELAVRVDAALHLELTTTNSSPTPFVITQALHAYFLVRHIADIAIRGLDGASCHDSLGVRPDALQAGPLAIRGETDLDYSGTPAECVIDDPGIGRRLVVSKRGSRATTVWNPWIEKSRRLSGLAPEDYLRFVCVEPANAGADAVTLAPGQSHKLAVTIRAELRNG